MHRGRPTSLRHWGLALLLLIAAPFANAAEPQFPTLSGRVVDEAKVLSPQTRQNLSDKLDRHERDTGEQVVVVTVPSLQGYPIEDFGYRLGRSWGIGQKGRDNGAVFLVAPKERSVRIEVGYGLEGRLTDAASRGIIERNILPAFRQGDMERGVIAGTDAILATLRGDVAPEAGGSASSDRNPVDLSPLLFLVLVILFLGFRMGFFGLVGGATFANMMLRGSSRRGFSGGGGSFGGGGASGRW
jgi:uncharacterized protein